MVIWIAATPAAGLGALGGLPFLVILLVVMWVVLFLPQRNQQKKKQEMLKTMKRGDQVVTIGGIHGSIEEIKDDQVTLRVADKVNMVFSRSAISSIVSK